MNWFSAIAVYFFLIQIFFKRSLFGVQFSLESAKLEQRVGDSFMPLPARMSAHWRWGVPLGSMTSRGLLRAEAEPPGLRATIQRFQLQACCFSMSDADGL